MTDRAAAAALAGALAFVASYAAQRGLAWSDEAPALASAHTAFYWRCALAALHAGMVAALVGVGARDPARLLRARWAVWAVVVPSVAALVWLQ